MSEGSKPIAPGELQEASRRGRLHRAGSALLWYVLPGLATLAVAAYILGATIGHANPPVVPVDGVSMRPTLHAGDLVFLKGVNPKTLRKGDIIAVNVPERYRKQYSLPAHVVHRIFAVEHTRAGLVFKTKGDANSGVDVFQTPSNDVIGEMAFHITGAGYPILFFRSRQGEIFVGAAAVVALLYFLLGMWEDRRVIVEGTAVTMQSVLAETQELREAIATARTVVPAGAPAGPEERPGDGRESALVDEVRLARESGEETSATMRELVGAIGEYGEHLRSHTAVMKNLAATTGELQRATSELRFGVEDEPSHRSRRRSAPPRPAPRSTWRPLLDLPVLADPSLARVAPVAERRQRVDTLIERVSKRVEETSRARDQLRRELET